MRLTRVEAGWDPDSAAATVGSVLGGSLGADRLPPAWSGPLDGRIATSLPRGDVRVVDLAERARRLSRVAA